MKKQRNTMKVIKKSSVITLNIFSKKQKSKDSLRKYAKSINFSFINKNPPFLNFEVLNEDQDEKGFYYTVTYKTEVY